MGVTPKSELAAAIEAEEVAELRRDAKQQYIVHGQMQRDIDRLKEERDKLQARVDAAAEVAKELHQMGITPHGTYSSHWQEVFLRLAAKLRGEGGGKDECNP